MQDGNEQEQGFNFAAPFESIIKIVDKTKENKFHLFCLCEDKSIEVYYEYLELWKYGNEEEFFKCKNCLYSYFIPRKPYYPFLMSVFFRTTLAFLIVLFLTTFIGFIFQSIEVILSKNEINLSEIVLNSKTLELGTTAIVYFNIIYKITTMLLILRHIKVEMFNFRQIELIKFKIFILLVFICFILFYIPIFFYEVTSFLLFINKIYYTIQSKVYNWIILSGRKVLVVESAEYDIKK